MCGCRYKDMKKGFTLIEITIALAVLVIGLISVLALFPFGMFSNKRASDYSIATILAQQQLDSIKATSGYYIGGATSFPRWFPSSGVYEIADFPNFRWYALVTQTNIDKFYGVELKVYWLDPRPDTDKTWIDGTTKYAWESFLTYIADYA